jgi:phenylacetate-CoA ligase
MYKFLLNNLILPLGEQITGIHLTKELNKLDVLTKKSKIELEELQKNKLFKLLTHATLYSKYYRGLNIEINKGNLYESLKKFPILTKNILRQNSSDLLTEDKEKLIANASSGSTGEQSVVYWSKKEQTINRATQMLWWKWSGYSFGDHLIQTGINPHRPGIKKYKDFFMRTNYIQAFAHHEKELVETLNKLNKNKEYTLAGYASSLYVISQIVKKNNIKLKIKTAVSWGDKLFEHYKKSIKEVFGCKTYETYGSAEGLLTAAQKDLDYMYLMDTNVYVEIVDDLGNEVKDGELGHVLITNLNGFAMPLIRYKVGDLAIKLPKEKHPKNPELNLSILQKVIGRDTDLVKTPNGNYMVVHSFTGIFEHIPQIKQFCVIQENLNGISIQYIKAEGFTENLLEQIRGKILEFLKEDFIVNFQEVDFIPSTPSGKPQLIISKLLKK